MTLGIEWAPVAGALVGLIVGLTGVGGGALMAPILLLGFGFDLPTVVATDLLFATITKLVASGMHNRNQLVDWQIARRLWIGSIPATVLVMMLAFNGLLLANQDWITRLLGALILFSGLSLLFGSKLQLYQRAKRLNAPARFKRYQSPLTGMSGFILGALVSLTSIGAGALGAIMLRALYPLRMEPKKLVATDTIHAIPISLLGGLGYLAMNQTNIQLLGLLLAGSIPAVLLGTRLLKKAPPELIKKILGIALLAASLKLIV
jgi:uncharacterized membrane protein YfcA